MGRESRDYFNFIKRRSLNIALWKNAYFSQMYGVAGNTEFDSQVKGDHLTGSLWTGNSANPDGGASIISVDYAESKNTAHNLIENAGLENTNLGETEPFKYRFVFINGTINLEGVAANRMPGESDDTALNWIENGPISGAEVAVLESFYTGPGQTTYDADKYVFKIDWGGMVGTDNAVWIYLDSDDNHLKIVYKDKDQAAWALCLTFSPKME